MSDTADTYAQLGRQYAQVRRADPRIEQAILDALGSAATVVNVGAGTGSYEPRDRSVIAVEPSATMLAQRPDEAAPAIQAWAENLPFDDDEFDAAMAVLTVHHWIDCQQGLAEMRRVSHRQVVLTWDPEVFRRFWLITDYFPELLDTERDLATLHAVIRGLSTPDRAPDVVPVLVPADCTDGFLAAHWRRPHAYLDPRVRAGMSGLQRLNPAIVANGVQRLTEDLATGLWARRHAATLPPDGFDAGYRLVIASRSQATP